MNRNKKFARIATGLTAGALLTVSAATLVSSANAAPRVDQNSTTSSATSTQAQGKGMGRGHGHPGGPGMNNGINRGTPVHGEMVVKNADGTYSTRVNVNGTATAVSATSITVKAADGFTATFIIGSTTNVRTSTAGGTIADIKVGDAVHVVGTKSGTTLSADEVHAGMPGGPKATPAA